MKEYICKKTLRKWCLIKANFKITVFKSWIFFNIKQSKRDTTLDMARVAMNKNKTKKGQKMVTTCVQKQRIDRITQTRFIDWRNIMSMLIFYSSLISSCMEVKWEILTCK